MRALAAGPEKATVAEQEELGAALLDLGRASACSWFSLQEEIQNGSVKAGQTVIAFSEE